MADQPTLRWRVLNAHAQIGHDDDVLAAVLFTVDATEPGGSEFLEFYCVLVGPPVHDEVLFGVGQGTGKWWVTRWDRGRYATEYVYFDSIGRWPTD